MTTIFVLLGKRKNNVSMDSDVIMGSQDQEESHPSSQPLYYTKKDTKAQGEEGMCTTSQCGGRDAGERNGKETAGRERAGMTKQDA